MTDLDYALKTAKELAGSVISGYTLSGSQRPTGLELLNDSGISVKYPLYT